MDGSGAVVDAQKLGARGPIGPGSPPVAHQFKPGMAANPGGKPKHAKNRLSNAFLSRMADDFEKHGVRAIERMREERPHEYIKAIASLMPRELEVENRSALDALEEDALEAALMMVQRLIAAKQQSDENGIIDLLPSAAPQHENAQVLEHKE